MLYLFLAIISSALISTIMRLSESKRASEAGMFIWNYLVCGMLSLGFSRGVHIPKNFEGMGFVFLLGLITGILFLSSFALMQRNIKINGVVSSAVFMKLGVVVSILLALVAFREYPKYEQAIGIALALIAIVVFNFQKNALSQIGNIALLIFLLIMGGVTDSMLNVYNKLGDPALSDMYFVILFGAALICSILLFLFKREKMGRWDVVFGIIIGIPNYFSSRFLLKSLDTVPSIIAYPVYSVTTILMISLIGVIAFRERLSKQKWIALGLVLVAVVLMQ